MYISVSLRLTGDALQPDAVTDLLAVPPTRARFKGESRPGSPARAKHGQWALRIPGNSPTLDERVQAAHQCLEPLAIAARLSQLPGVEYAWLDFCVIADPDDVHASSIDLLFSSASLALLAELGLAVEISVYPPEGEETGEV